MATNENAALRSQMLREFSELVERVASEEGAAQMLAAVAAREAQLAQGNDELNALAATLNGRQAAITAGEADLAQKRSELQTEKTRLTQRGERITALKSELALALDGIGAAVAKVRAVLKSGDDI